ncbi:programmed cell death protein 2 [Hyaloraphidium curvatum]|nr:programmed cell death protein 2 [Hyaloraphidium curvatum]
MDLAEASAADLDLPDVDGKLGPEEYEKAVYPKGMSKIFRTFQKVVERAPEQALRYEGEPTFFSEPVAPASVPRCPRCGGKRAYEFQVMPSVLTTLRMMDHTSISADSKPEGKGKGKGKQAPVNPRGIDAGMDFGTVLVYTCESSCQGRGDGSEGWSWFDEVCVVQVERE